jgi:hypothetical protein
MFENSDDLYMAHSMTFIFAELIYALVSLFPH